MTANRFSTVAVLKGGMGSEREVSLRSGRGVAEALRQAGLRVHELEIQDVSFTLPEEVEAVFPVLHGELGEDGLPQWRLEKLGIPYVGSRSWEMPRSFDKELTHLLLERQGIPMPDWQMVRSVREITLPVPLVLKAPRQGSSIGMEIVHDAGELESAFNRVRPYASRILVERFIPGTECTVGILDEAALPVVEIRPASGAYDYQAKYERGDTRYLVPAPYSEAQTALLQSLALQCFAQLGGRHLARVDFRVDPQGNPFVLEMNTLPGFTATSLLPKAAAAAGLDFPALCVRILNLAEIV